MKTKRRSIAFTERQTKWLNEQAKLRNRTVAGVVRLLVDEAINPLMKELRETTIKAMVPALFKKIMND